MQSVAHCPWTVLFYIIYYIFRKCYEVLNRYKDSHYALDNLCENEAYAEKSRLAHAEARAALNLPMLNFEAYVSL